MKYLLWGIICLIAFNTQAADVILMVGDGMGYNHLSCTENHDFSMKKLPVHSNVKTKSADHDVTDSSAAATAYACGQKTNNGYVRILPNGKNCETLAELAAKKGYYVGIISNDIQTGATPSSFYAHTTNRRAEDEILPQLKQAQKHMDIRVAVPDIYNETRSMLSILQKNKKPFFLMIEGALIDVQSHKNHLDLMKNELKQFDKTVELVNDFIEKNKNTTLIVLADHETGGLSKKCEFTSHKHTGVDIPLFAAGRYATLFKGDMDNTEVSQKMKTILFEK